MAKPTADVGGVFDAQRKTESHLNKTELDVAGARNLSWRNQRTLSERIAESSTYHTIAFGKHTDGEDVRVYREAG